MGTTTVALIVAAGVAALVLVAAGWMVLRARASADRRLDAALGRIGDSMDTLSQSLLAVVEGAEGARTPGADLGLSLDLGDVLQETARSASVLLAADGAGVSVWREHGDAASATFGIGVAEAPDAGLEPPDASAWGAATVQWQPGPATGVDTVRSALAIPLRSDAARLGTLAVYSRAPRVFTQEDAERLAALGAEAVPAIVNASLHEATLELVRTDAMTGFRNRRGYDESLELEIARARRAARPLTVVLLDLDRFHDVNARFGYQVGDAVLVAFTEVVQTVSRVSDVLCRRGGEEFVVVLPDTECREGIRFDLRLRAAVAATEFPTGEPVTFSTGLTELREGDDSAAVDDRIGRMVQSAKAAGRNRLVHDCELTG
jgi:diguanylate cyclase (GGDEF)-like protein